MSFALKRAIRSVGKQTLKLAELYKRGILPSMYRLRNLRRSIEYLEKVLIREFSHELPREKARKLAYVLTFVYRTLLELSYGKPIRGTFLIRVDYQQRKIIVKTIMEPIGKRKERHVISVELP